MFKKSHQPSHERNLSRRERLIAGAIAPLVGAAAVAGCSVSVEAKNPAAGTSQESQTYTVDVDEVEEMIENSQLPEAPKKGSELTTKERFQLFDADYFEIDESLRAHDQAPYFKEGIADSYEAILKAPDIHLTPEEIKAKSDGTFYLPDLNKPREQWTDQDLLNYYTLAIYFVTAQPDPNAGKQSLSVVARPGTKTFENIEKWIEENPNPDWGIIAMFKAVPTPVSGADFVPSDITSIPGDWKMGHLVGHESLGDSKVDYTFFIDYDDGNQNTVSISAETFDSVNDPTINRLISKNAGR